MRAFFNGVVKEVPEYIAKEFIKKEETAVITVDMHEGHLSIDSNCPCPSPRGREIIDSIDTFTKSARELGVPVIHVKSVMRADGADDKKYMCAWKMLFPVSVGEIPNINEHAKEGTKWNELSIHTEDTDYYVNTKKRLSVFYATDLELLLRNLGIKRIVLIGCMTDCCILNAAFDGSNRDFRVIVPKDLTRGTKELEESAYQIISLHLGLVVKSKELINEWKIKND